MINKKNHNVEKDYKVFKANNEQLDTIINTKYKSFQEKQDGIIVFFIANKEENVVGHIFIEEKIMPSPLNGKDWFIWNIFTLPELRQQGIASILLKKTIKYAKQENIQNLIGSCTNKPAHMFWNKHNFCFIIYGQKIDNINKPNEHGNYPHMIFYRLNKSNKKNIQEQKEFRIIKANKSHLDWIFDNHILNDGLKFFHDKRDDIFGFAALDNENNLIGIITAYTYEMGSPLDGDQWMIPYIYVHHDYRKQKVAYTLINKMKETAKATGISQLICLFLNDEIAKFFVNMNFDICNYYIMIKDGKCPISAGIRVI